MAKIFNPFEHLFQIGRYRLPNMRSMLKISAVTINYPQNGNRLNPGQFSF